VRPQRRPGFDRHLRGVTKDTSFRLSGTALPYRPSFFARGSRVRRATPDHLRGMLPRSRSSISLGCSSRPIKPRAHFPKTVRLPCVWHFNPFFTLMYAYAFVLKAVPGPDPEARAHQSSVRRVYAATGGGRTKDGIRAEPSIDLPRGLVRHLEQLWVFVLWQLTRFFGQ
jgi:hypothetical protein